VQNNTLVNSFKLLLLSNNLQTLHVQTSTMPSLLVNCTRLSRPAIITVYLSRLNKFQYLSH
jgi:hypothetical protein